MFLMEQLLETERGIGLYKLPPGMLLCTSAEGVMRLINRSRVTIWRYVKSGQLRGFNVAGNLVIPLADIGGLISLTETQVYNIAIAHRLPLWQLYPEGK